MKMHDELLEKIENIRKISEKTKLNFIVNKKVRSKLGIIVSGVSYNYVMDAFNDLELKIPLLKLGLTYPLPKKKIKKFIKRFKSIFVVEELEPILEEAVHCLAKDVNPKLKIFGKNLLPKSGEYKEEFIISALKKLTGKKLHMNLEAHSRMYEKLKLAKRFAVLCPGCPHRSTFWAARVAAGMDTVFGGDVGCYILGLFPPYHTQDFVFSMGASEGIIHGIKKTTGQKTIAFVGDSTFFHAGIPGLINTVFNKSNPLIIILDNRITAMTGHQPHPGVGRTGMGEKTKAIRIENIVKACGIKHVKVVDAWNVKKMIKTIKKFLKNDEVSVIVAKRECQLLAVRNKKRAGKKIARFEINQKKCKRCGLCLYYFACPAMYTEDGKFYIDKNLCTGCGVCAQICINNAIRPIGIRKVKKK
jgi:indolepyruvate ferredoxin oxidoreductase alpha subunit